MERRALYGFGVSASLGGGGLWPFFHGLQLLVGFGVGLASSQGICEFNVVPGSSWGGIGSDRCYVLSGLLVCGDLGDVWGTFTWVGGGSRIVWSLAFHVEL